MSRVLRGTSVLPRLTLLGRSVLLLAAELLANAICWITCGILFGRGADTRPILSLALLAWTIGLRHALDADHISAIDNATRSLINMGQLPVTCGLFFSLGHSTIVVVVNVAIAISTDVYNHIDGVGAVGGIVGSAVSASFLFIVGLANSIILFRILRKRHRAKKRRAARTRESVEAGATRKARPDRRDSEIDGDLSKTENAEDDGDDVERDESHGNTLMMKVIGPVVTFVDRPWKMYPVGLLFGFGFDTASSIALLAISAIAKRGPDGHQIAPGNIVVLPLLFTVGMTLVDSLDSIVMLYSYAGFPDRSFALFESPATGGVGAALPRASVQSERLAGAAASPAAARADVEMLPRRGALAECEANEKDEKDVPEVVAIEDVPGRDPGARLRVLRVKRNAMSSLSILLTVMSIFVAFSISLITIMGLVGDNCAPCQNAANAPDGGGLAGRWWRGWAKANDNSGYIGAAIVGSFIAVVSVWYGARYLYRQWQARTKGSAMIKP